MVLMCLAMILFLLTGAQKRRGFCNGYQLPRFTGSFSQEKLGRELRWTSDVYSENRKPLASGKGHDHRSRYCCCGKRGQEDVCDRRPELEREAERQRQVPSRSVQRGSVLGGEEGQGSRQQGHPWSQVGGLRIHHHAHW